MYGLREALFGRSVIEKMVHNEVPYDAEAIGNWFMRTLGVTAHARLMRETLIGEEENHRISYNIESEIIVDFEATDVYRSGIHIAPERMKSLLAIESPKPREVRYYEGEAIYLRATTPANPTNSLLDLFFEEHHTSFSPDNYVSIVPRLKNTYWGVAAS